MKISILTLFPQMFVGPFDYSILKRAQEKNQLTIDFVNIRDFGIGKHKVVDDKPYGGGMGMVLRVDVIGKAIESAKCNPSTKLRTRVQSFDKAQDKSAILRQSSGQECNERIILTDPRGERFNQQKARELLALDHLILIAGHYEGIDERVREHLVDETISIGDYVLTGGELPVMVIIDAVTRLLPGVLKPQATIKESFSLPTSKLEYPQYTRPQSYKGISVPEVLVSGNHRQIEQWREKKMQR